MSGLPFERREELKTTWSKGQPLPLSDGLDRTMKAAASEHEQSVDGARRHRDDTHPRLRSNLPRPTIGRSKAMLLSALLV